MDPNTIKTKTYISSGRNTCFLLVSSTMKIETAFRCDADLELVAYTVDAIRIHHELGCSASIC
jgi:hypothetical protein